jgi:hypothetical protein
VASGGAGVTPSNVVLNVSPNLPAECATWFQVLIGCEENPPKIRHRPDEDVDV